MHGDTLLVVLAFMCIVIFLRFMCIILIRWTMSGRAYLFYAPLVMSYFFVLFYMMGILHNSQKSHHMIYNIVDLPVYL